MSVLLSPDKAVEKLMELDTKTALEFLDHTKGIDLTIESIDKFVNEVNLTKLLLEKT